MQYRFQNADFDADFESAEKLQKLMQKIINEKVTESLHFLPLFLYANVFIM
jgi:hypothetical protein